jgi:hypothetical protein
MPAYESELSKAWTKIVEAIPGTDTNRLDEVLTRVVAG